MKEDKKEKKKVFRYVSVIVKKLLFFGWLVMCVLISLLFFFNKSYFHLKSYIPVVVGLLPFISFGIYIIKSKLLKKTRDRLAYCKYNIFFPFYFYYHKNPKKNKRIDLSKIIDRIATGDVLLRRYNGYLDGLIFSENSYFTHVGICDKKSKDDISVWHCNGEKGVHESLLADFCNGDDIAVLRFSFEETKQEKLIRKYISKDTPLTYEIVKLSEAAVFENLMDKTKQKNNTAFPLKIDQTLGEYRDMVVKRASSLIDRPYDFNFNFHDFEAFSCVEYVWYCFKFLFPLHRIRVKDFEFFQIFNMPVIIPDVFVKNDFFSYVYSSVNIKKKAGKEADKDDLIKFVGKDRNEIWFFLLSILVGDIIILYLCKMCNTTLICKFLQHLWVSIFHFQ